MPTVTLEIVDERGGRRVSRDLPLPVSIGREPANTIPLPDNRASRFHAVIRFENENICIEDLKSTNRTRVNGVEVEAIPSESAIRFASARRR